MRVYSYTHSYLLNSHWSHTNTHIQTRRYTHIHTQLSHSHTPHTLTQLHMHTHKLTHTLTHSHTHIHTHTHTLKHTHTTHTHTHSHGHTLLNMHKHNIPWSNFIQLSDNVINTRKEINSMAILSHLCLCTRKHSNTYMQTWRPY